MMNKSITFPNLCIPTPESKWRFPISSVHKHRRVEYRSLSFTPYIQSVNKTCVSSDPRTLHQVGSLLISATQSVLLVCKDSHSHFLIGLWVPSFPLVSSSAHSIKQKGLQKNCKTMPHSQQYSPSMWPSQQS